MKSLKPMISVICLDCGKQCGSTEVVATFWVGTCDVCRERKPVCKSRHFNYGLKVKQ